MSRFARALAVWSLSLAAGGCDVGFEDSAPRSTPARRPGPCGSTSDLFPRLLQFIEADRFEPLRGVIEARLVVTEENPSPEPSLRTAVRALLDLVSQLGVDRTRQALQLTQDPTVENRIANLTLGILEILDGQRDGVERYEVSEAAGRFVRTCDPDNLLGALEALLRLESQVEPGRPWLVVVLDRLGEILVDPALAPLFESFEGTSSQGRPAVVALMGQIMTFLAADEDPIEPVTTLLDSAVYPLISDPALEARIRGLIDVLAEATDGSSGVFGPLQGAMRCGNRQPLARDVLLGFLYDLVVTEDLGIQGLLEGAGAFGESTSVELNLLADFLSTVRADVDARDDLRGLLEVFLESEAARETFPVLMELIRSGVIGELVDGVVVLLDGCTEGPQ